MFLTGEFRERLRHRIGPILGVTVFCLLVGSVEGATQVDCEKAVPVDDFSTNIDSLLTKIEGSGFPSDANVDAWPTRIEDIQAILAHILVLSGDDSARRKATIQVMVVAASMSESSSQSRKLGTGPESGEVRAWARHSLKRYTSVGLSRQDMRYVDKPFILELQQAWTDQEVSLARRSIPIYQAKAAALRALATFQKPAACK